MPSGTSAERARTFSSILFKTTLDILLAALVPLGIVVWLSGLRTGEALSDSARDNVQLIASVTANRIDQLVTDTSRLADQISLDHDIVEACRNNSVRNPDVQARLQAVTNTNPDIASVFVINAKAEGISSTQASHVGTSFSFREYATTALAGNATVSPWTVGKISGESGVYFSHPVYASADHSAKPVGATVVKLHGTSIDALVHSVNIGAAGYGILANTDGVIISTPRADEIYHSFSPLSREHEEKINPKLSYSQDSIESIDAPELQAPATDPSAHGSILFTRKSDAGRENWVAGYAPMSSRPWKVLVVQPARQFSAPTRALLRQQGIVALGVAILAGLLAFWRARTLSRPIVALKDASSKLASGDFSVRAPEQGADELQQLARTFNRMVPELQQSVELKKSMELAQRIQQSLLPQQPPTIAGLDVAGRSQYCDATGGDYYDFAESVELPGHQLLLAIGDVTGHGLGAALLMCTARAALRSAALGSTSLGLLMSRINRVLTQDAIQDMYMTMTLAIIDGQAGTVQYACAAHDPIVAYDPATKSFRELSEGSIMLGVMPDMEYETYTASGFTPGTVLFIGTDGIWEAHNAAGEMFGKERMNQAIQENAHGTAAEVGMAVEQALSAFLGKTRIQDDVTYVVVKILAERPLTQAR